MGYNQSTELFYGQEVESVSWEDGEHLQSGPIYLKVTGDWSSGEYLRHWVVAKESVVELSEGKYGTEDAVNVTKMAYDNLANMQKWNGEIQDFWTEHNLKPIGVIGWVAAASGS